MKRIFKISGLLSVALFPIACQKTYVVSPLSATSTGNGRMVTTLAGSAGVTGATNATGTAASFSYPTGVAVDSSGNVFVGDDGNLLVRKITPGGVVSTLAGQVGVTGAVNGTGTSATFNDPRGVAVDSSGNVYVADTQNNLIREISPSGVVTTLAASSVSPSAVAVDSSGNVYVSDTANSIISKITPGGMASTLAGSAGVTGAANGTGTSATFAYPWGIAVDSSGAVYVADQYNSLIRKITPGGMVSTFAGQAGVTGSTNGTGTAALFNFPRGVAVDSSGNVYVADTGNELIREITSGGVVSTIAGQPTVAGATNGPALSASFYSPIGIAVDSSGDVYVADFFNDLIRKISP